MFAQSGRSYLLCVLSRTVIFQKIPTEYSFSNERTFLSAGEN